MHAAFPLSFSVRPRTSLTPTRRGDGATVGAGSLVSGVCPVLTGPSFTLQSLSPFKRWFIPRMTATTLVFIGAGVGTKLATVPPYPRASVGSLAQHHAAVEISFVYSRTPLG